MNARERIYLAADVSTEDELLEVLAIAQELDLGLKVGLELCHAIGTKKALSLVRALNRRIFLDIKLVDIPETLMRTMRNLVDCGIKLINVYAAAGKPSMLAVNEHKGDVKVLAVTVLTTMDDADCIEVFTTPVEPTVIRLATLANEAGCDGLVCSPRDLPFLNALSEFDRMEKATAGIRPEWYPADDQKRSATPFVAALGGSQYFVVGRPIRRPPPEIGSPARAIELIVKEIEDADAQLVLPFGQ
jgi:orotidine-5'-phosphate decarboxylase